MQITEHVHAIRIPFQIPIAPGKTVERLVYSYLIYDAKVICLIDSGVASSEDIIFDYISKSGREPDEITLMILTHSHPDHIGSAKAIKDATNCTVGAHFAAKAWIEDVALQFRERAVPGFHSLVAGPVHIDRFLKDGDTVAVGKLTLEVFHTPGHSKGAISLFFQKDGALFSGDAIPKPNDIPIYEDVVTAIDSIERLKNIAGIKFLLASWEHPKEGEAAYKMMDEGLDYLQAIHNAIRKISDEAVLRNPMKLCKQMVRILGLPAIAANPLVARSFVSHLEVLDHQYLLQH